ncbi:MAG: aminopeptidase, partial [Thermoplasmata archaeon]|nr:aminopeptidase [Thermoplasmata archaeon]
AVESRKLGSFASLSKVERAALDSANVYIHIWGPEDRPRRDKLPDKVQERVVAFNEEWYRRARKAGVRGARLTVGQATDPIARTFHLNGPAWRRRLAEAGAVDSRRMQALGNRVARAIQHGRELRIRHPNGTDLRIRPRGVHTRVDAGVLDAAAMKRPYGMLANNPTGQVFVAWDGGDASGTFVSNRSVYVGPYVFGGIRWSFAHGRLVQQSYATGGALFRKQYRAAPKGKDRLGYLSIGLNKMGRDLPPCEDTEEGAAILGIGSNTFAGGRNKVPFQGFALVGQPTIQVDGVTIASGGRIR